jgi:hypothetical protein
MAISESGSRMLIHGDKRLMTMFSHSMTYIYVPDVHISVFIFDAVLCSPITIIHDIQFPARREATREDFGGSFQSPHALNYEERTALDTGDEITCTARPEFPLQGSTVYTSHGDDQFLL